MTIKMFKGTFGVHTCEDTNGRGTKLTFKKEILMSNVHVFSTAKVQMR